MRSKVAEYLQAKTDEHNTLVGLTTMIIIPSFIEYLEAAYGEEYAKIEAEIYTNEGVQIAVTSMYGAFLVGFREGFAVGSKP